MDHSVERFCFSGAGLPWLSWKKGR